MHFFLKLLFNNLLRVELNDLFNSKALLNLQLKLKLLILFFGLEHELQPLSKFWFFEKSLLFDFELLFWSFIFSFLFNLPKYLLLFFVLFFDSVIIK